MIEWHSFDMALLAGRAAFLVFSFAIAAVAFTRWRRLAERESQASALALREALAGIARLEQAARDTTERLRQLESQGASAEARLAALGTRLDSHGRAEAAPAQSNYEIAIRLARGGAQRDELMASCGLTRQEAELVQRLHGPERRPPLRPAAA